MCGIAGYAGFFEAGLAERMTARLRHRGPDSAGIAEFAEAGMAVGIRRLAIIDPETGDQPMVSSDGLVHLVMNGEIYNYGTLRRDFVAAGYRFRSRADTEVALAAYLKWGHEAWCRLRGMFAIAVVDRRGVVPRLVLARDRVGIKPLYVVERGGKLVFASELKALLAWAGCPTQVHLPSVCRYLALRYVPGPRSMFAGVEKFPPGHALEFKQGKTTILRWWQPPVRSTSAVDRRGSEAAHRLGTALRAAVSSHLVADVPVGAFLSGGIDSCVLAALMSEGRSAPLHTFSIGFSGFPGDDRDGAALAARHLRTTHHEIECDAGDMAALPDLVWALDEPIGDAIVVPMAVLAREARKVVKVVLSGEGADEILGGYVFHRRLVQLARLQRFAPAVFWKLAAWTAARIPEGLLDRAFDYPGTLGRQGRDKVAALLRAVASDPLLALYRRSVALFDAEDMRTLAGPGLAPHLATPSDSWFDNTLRSGMTPLQTLIDAQFVDWLPDDILMKADKMTMAHSLELRVPFMDEEVIQAAIDLPDDAKLTRATNKAALREFARTLLPERIVRGPKRAFYVPLELYVGTKPLRDIFRAMLDPARLRRRGLVKAEAVAALASDVHMDGFLALRRQFSIVVLELWFDRFAPDAVWS